MSQNNLQIEQIKLRKKFLKKGIKMLAPETIFFLKKQQLAKMLQLNLMLYFPKRLKLEITLQ